MGIRTLPTSNTLVKMSKSGRLASCAGHGPFPFGLTARAGRFTASHLAIKTRVMLVFVGLRDILIA